jgi:hypothetical protein
MIADVILLISYSNQLKETVATEDMVNLSADLVETWLCVRDFGF